MKFSQNYNQKQVQKLAITQQMQQSIQILKSTNEELTSLIKECGLENPFIEVNSSIQNDLRQVDLSQMIANRQPSLDDYLLEQVHLTMRNTPIRTLVIYLIENLDDNGYLNFDIEDLYTKQKFDKTLVLDALTLLQRLDPPGIGARDLQECLMLQTEFDQAAPKFAYEILKNDFDLLVDHNWKAIADHYPVSLADVKLIFKYIQNLSPAPGAGYQHTSTDYVTPDLIVSTENNCFNIELNQSSLPTIHFKQDYFDSFEDADENLQNFLKQKRTEFDQLARQIHQRQQTILHVGQAIVLHQRDFFLKDDHPLKPLLLRDIAHELQLNESTISRAVNGKYLKTSFGIYELKSFFSSAAEYADNQEISIDSVQRLIKNLIDNEDPQHPLSDQKIVSMLKEKEINISRRTVAKYRSNMGIKSSSKRKSDL